MKLGIEHFSEIIPHAGILLKRQLFVERVSLSLNIEGLAIYDLPRQRELHRKHFMLSMCMTATIRVDTLVYRVVPTSRATRGCIVPGSSSKSQRLCYHIFLVMTS